MTMRTRKEAATCGLGSGSLLMIATPDGGTADTVARKSSAAAAAAVIEGGDEQQDFALKGKSRN